MWTYLTSEVDPLYCLLAVYKIVWMIGSKRLAIGSACSAWHIDIKGNVFP
jgi:hypothetical protein